jgi:transcriptional regulator with XRE-family HTH domain
MNLKELRKKRHLTQLELAEKTGLALVTISKYEQNCRKPSCDTIQKLADALSYSPKVVYSAICSKR